MSEASTPRRRNWSAACGGRNPSGSTAVTAADRPAVVTSAPTGTLERSGPVPAEPVPVADRLVVVAAVPETAPADAGEGTGPVSGVSDGLLSVAIPPCTPSRRCGARSVFASATTEHSPRRVDSVDSVFREGPAVVRRHHDGYGDRHAPYRGAGDRRAWHHAL